MPRGAAELAVGGVLEAGVALLRDDLADRVVLDGAQLGVVDRAGLVVGARLAEALGAQEAADVVAAEWG